MIAPICGAVCVTFGYAGIKLGYIQLYNIDIWVYIALLLFGIYCMVVSMILYFKKEKKESKVVKSK